MGLCGFSGWGGGHFNSSQRREGQALEGKVGLGEHSWGKGIQRVVVV